MGGQLGVRGIQRVSTHNQCQSQRDLQGIYKRSLVISLNNEYSIENSKFSIDSDDFRLKNADFRFSISIKTGEMKSRRRTRLP